jgi:hypothetical protein
MHSGRMNTWGLRGTLAAIGISAAVAGVGGAAIYAATDDGPHMMGMQGGPGGPHDHGGPPDPHGAPAPAPEPAALHGEFVESDGPGKFTTVLSQTGRVTAISPTSVTARSEDGFSQTYVLAALDPAASKAPSFAVDDAVTIRATRSGTTVSVTNIEYARTGGGAAAPPPIGGPP